MPREQAMELWRLVGATLAGVCVTGAGFYIVEGSRHATLADVHESVEKEGPYVRDRGVIFTRLDSIDDQLKKLQQIDDKLDRIESKIAQR